MSFSLPKMASKHQASRGVCWMCGQLGHISKKCPNKAIRRDLKCFNCGCLGHFKKDCPSLQHSRSGQNHTTRFKKQEECHKGTKKPAVFDTEPNTGQCKPDINSTSGIHIDPAVQNGMIVSQTSSICQSSDQSIESSSSIKSETALTKTNNEKSLLVDKSESTSDKTPQVIDTTVKIDKCNGIHPSIDSNLPAARKKQTVPHEEETGLLNLSDDLFTDSRDRNKSHEHNRYKSSRSQKNYSEFNFYETFSALPSFVDTHCHLEYLMERLRINSFNELSHMFQYPFNFDGCISSFCDSGAYSTFSCCDELLAEPKVWASFGFHPHHARYFTRTMEDKLLQRITHPKCIAFGEMGLDYSEHSLKQSSKEEQKHMFEHLLTISPCFEKPLVLHCRDAENDMLKMLKEKISRDYRIHLHCYTGSMEMASEFITEFPNLYIGLTGHMTYYKSHIAREVAKTIPLNRILLETDAPYMLPAQINKYRDNNRWSHPPMVVYVAQEIAKVRFISIEEVLTVTRENVSTIYGI